MWWFMTVKTLFSFSLKGHTTDFIYLKAVITNISLKLCVQITTVQRVLDIHFLKILRKSSVS